MTKATHRYNVVTRSNKLGDDVGAEDALILPSGVLVFMENDRMILSYSANEWLTFEYAYQETGDGA